MTPVYPRELPPPTQNGRAYSLVDPLQRTTMSTGRARQRRRFSDVPQMTQLRWVFTAAEASAFEAWWRDALIDGALWYTGSIRTVLGFEEYDLRFTGVYSGPTKTGAQLWTITAEVELRERAVLPIDWGLVPGFVAQASIFDKAMNREWPRHVNYVLLTEDAFVLSTEDGFGLITE